MTRAARALARRHGITNRQMLERLIVAAEDRISAKLDPMSAEWGACFGAPNLRRRVTA
jgi:hypothetical protein